MTQTDLTNKIKFILSNFDDKHAKKLDKFDDKNTKQEAKFKEYVKTIIAIQDAKVVNKFEKSYSPCHSISKIFYQNRVNNTRKYLQ